MRHTFAALFAAIVVMAVSAQAVPALAADFDPTKASYPGAVALSEPSPGHWVYRQFPSLTNLYIRELDPKGGESTCNIDDGCAAAWPPLYAKDNETPIGEWTIIERQFGAKQWAYKGKPVYRRFHDLPEAAEKEGFHLLAP